MYGDIYPMKHMGKTTDMFGWWMKFRLPQKLLFYAKTYPADRASYMQLLMLVLDFVVHYRLKITPQWYFCGMHGMS